MGYMYNCYSPLFPTEKLHAVTGSVFWNQHAYIHTHIKLQTMKVHLLKIQSIAICKRRPLHAKMRKLRHFLIDDVPSSLAVKDVRRDKTEPN